MHLHADAPAAESDAFALQPEPLLHARMSAELDRASGADHAMPRDRAVRGAQSPGDLTRVPGKSRGICHLAVGGDLASRNFPHWC